MKGWPSLSPFMGGGKTSSLFRRSFVPFRSARRRSWLANEAICFFDRGVLWVPPRGFGGVLTHEEALALLDDEDDVQETPVPEQVIVGLLQEGSVLGTQDLNVVLARLVVHALVGISTGVDLRCPLGKVQSCLVRFRAPSSVGGALRTAALVVEVDTGKLLEFAVLWTDDRDAFAKTLIVSQGIVVLTPIGPCWLRADVPYLTANVRFRG